MEVKSRDFASTLQAQIISKKTTFFLLCGPEFGLSSLKASEITKEYIGKNSNMVSVSLDQDFVLSDQGHLANEFFSSGFFSDKKVISLKNCNNKIFGVVKTIIQQSNLTEDSSGNCLVIVADDLDKASSLRQLFAKEKNCFSFVFYQESDAENLSFIRQYILSAKFNISQENLSLLHGFLSTNRLQVKNELDKLFLYKMDDENSNIEAEDIFNIVCDAADGSLFKLINGLYAKDLSSAIDGLYKLQSSDNYFSMLFVRSLTNYFEKIQQVMIDLRTSVSLEESATKIYGKMFTQANFMKQHIKKWTLLQVSELLSNAINLELQLKSASNNFNLILVEYFLIKTLINS